MKARLLRHAAALGASGLAFLLMINIPAAREHAPFVLFTAAVAGSAWYGGLATGLSSAVVGAVLACLVLISTATWWETALLAAIFGCVATAISIGAEMRRRAEKVRHHADALRAAVLSSLAGHIAVLDGDGTIIAVNDAWLTFAGRNGGNLRTVGVGASYFAVCATAGGTDADVARAEAGIRDVLSGRRQSFQMEYGWPTAERWFLMSVTPLGGAHRGATVAHEDITDRKRAEVEREASLQREREARIAAETSQQLLTALMECLPEGVTIADAPDVRIRMVSTYGQKLLGRSDELVHIPMERHVEQWDIYRADGESRPSADELPLTRATRHGEVVSDEEWVLRGADGTKRWVLCNAGPIRDAAGKVTGGVIAWRDITARKDVEARLRALNEQLQAVLDNTTAVIYVVDTAGRFVLLNRRWEELFHMRHDDLAGRPLETLFPPEVAAVLRENNRRVLSAGRPMDFEEVVPEADGPHVYLSTKVPLQGSDGRPYGVCGISTDITERKRAERRKDEFLAMLGHELRNPLAAVRNAITAARLDERQRAHALEVADRQARQLGRLVDDLLDVARITQGKIGLRRERLSIDAIIHRVVQGVRELVEDRGQTLALSLPASPLHVDGDSTRLEQVLTNLLTNAVKYTDAGGRIEVVAAREDAHAVIRVQDTGIGIAPDMLPRVFDLFVQAEQGLDRSRGGLGIGLTITRRLVELHGGTIEARSEGIGRGATFIVRLPTAAASDENQVRREDLLASSSTRSRVLIVEDNVDAADALRLLLELLGHEARVVYDGQAAIDAAQTDRFDVAVVDIGLPGMDGYEVARRIRALPGPRPLRLVALTGYGRDEDKQRALAAGYDAHLTKPVELDMLRCVVDAPGEDDGAPAPVRTLH